MVERKKKQHIPSSFWLAALAPLLYELQTMLFFSLFLVALEVQLYLRFLAAMGWEREELTIQRAATLPGCTQHCENTFQTLKKSNHCSLRPDKHRKIEPWWIFTWAEVRSRQSHHRIYLRGCHWKIHWLFREKSSAVEMQSSACW